MEAGGERGRAALIDSPSIVCSTQRGILLSAKWEKEVTRLARESKDSLANRDFLIGRENENSLLSYKSVGFFRLK